MLYNDHYNSEIFVEMFQDKLRWSKDYGGWFIYNGSIWESDKNDTIRQFAIEAYRELQKRLQAMNGNKDEVEPFARHVKRSGNHASMIAMLEIAKASLGVNADDFDNKPYLFNCINGTIDLENKKFLDFSPNHLLTKLSGTEFVKGSKPECPTWIKFVNEIFLGDKELIEFMQRTLGYSLTTSIEEQCLFIFYGQGRNGKSTFIEIITAMMGDYCKNCQSSTFTKKKDEGISNDIARLKGARVVTSAESNQSVTLDEAKIKQLTGGERVTARMLYKDFFDFRPTFKIFFSTNHKPNIHGTDTGIWRRIRMIPFNLNITEEQEDKDLKNKLLLELPGILRWAIEGYKMWREDGLKTPKAIIEATGEYRNEEDDIGMFIEDYCEIEPDEVVTAHEFKNRFYEIHRYHKSQKTISEYMRRKGFKRDDDRAYINGERVRVYHGLKLRSKWLT